MAHLPAVQRLRLIRRLFLVRFGSSIEGVSRRFLLEIKEDEVGCEGIKEDGGKRTCERGRTLKSASPGDVKLQRWVDAGMIPGLPALASRFTLSSWTGAGAALAARLTTAYVTNRSAAGEIAQFCSATLRRSRASQGSGDWLSAVISMTST